MFNPYRFVPKDVVDIQFLNCVLRHQRIQSDCSQTSMPSLNLHLEKLLELGSHSDVTFVVENEEYRLHKAILSSRSSVLGAMLRDHTNRIELDRISKGVFQFIVGFIYTDEVFKQTRHEDYFLENVLAAADKYALTSLKSRCEKRLVQEKLSVGNAPRILMLSHIHSAAELKEDVINFMAANIDDFVDDWEKLSIEPSLKDQILLKVIKKRKVKSGEGSGQEEKRQKVGA